MEITSNDIARNIICKRSEEYEKFKGAKNSNEYNINF